MNLKSWTNDTMQINTYKTLIYYVYTEASKPTKLMENISQESPMLYS